MLLKSLLGVATQTDPPQTLCSDSCRRPLPVLPGHTGTCAKVTEEQGGKCWTLASKWLHCKPSCTTLCVCCMFIPNPHLFSKPHWLLWAKLGSWQLEQWINRIQALPSVKDFPRLSLPERPLAGCQVLGSRVKGLSDCTQSQSERNWSRNLAM